MKIAYILLAFVFAACDNAAKHEEHTTAKTDTTVIDNKEPEKIPPPPAPVPPKDSGKIYSNQAFRNVTVVKTGDHVYRVKGQARVFEANISWVVEDGHNELKKGFQTTDAGAPEWGNFNFLIDVEKQRPNSTLHLILFESSAKDGSRQHIINIPLL